MMILKKPAAPWDASPQGAAWYGECTVGRDVPGGTETDYFYGYSNEEDPEPEDMRPDGWQVVESGRIDLREMRARASARPTELL